MINVIHRWTQSDYFFRKISFQRRCSIEGIKYGTKIERNICLIKYPIYLNRIDCCLREKVSMPWKVKKRCSVKNVKGAPKL